MHCFLRARPSACRFAASLAPGLVVNRVLPPGERCSSTFFTRTPFFGAGWCFACEAGSFAIHDVAQAARRRQVVRALSSALLCVIVVLCAAIGVVGFQTWQLTHQVTKLEDTVKTLAAAQESSSAKHSEELRRQEVLVVQRLNALAAAREVKRVQEAAEAATAEPKNAAKQKGAAEEKETEKEEDEAE